MTIGRRRATKAALSVGLLAVLATLVSYPTSGTTGTLIITADTTLTEDHFGEIVIAVDGIILDCAGFNVVGSGAGGPTPTHGVSLSERTGVTVKNCQVKEFDRGFYLEGSSNNTLEGNIARNNSKGFSLFPTIVRGAFGTFSSNNILANNMAIDNAAGFHLRYTSGNLLQNNTATNPGGNDFAFDAGTGFSVYYDGGNRIMNNTASGNSNGFDFQASSGNTVTENTAANNTRHGFLFTTTNRGDNNIITDNTANGNAYIGFELSGSSNNVLTGNTAIDNGGFSLGAGFAIDFAFPSNPQFASNNTLERNTVSGSPLGFAFRASDNNTLLNNAVKNNTAAFQLTHVTFCAGNPLVCVLRPSTNNTIYHNNIVNNTVQIDEVGDNSTATNDWHHPVLEEGNFWSDYDGIDDGSGGRVAGDGIGDTLIPHPGPDFDNFPFVNEIDNTPPTTVATQSGTAGVDGWFISPVVVTLSSLDDLSGPASTSYRIDEDPWTEYASPFTLDDGIHTIEYFSTDKAGNAETVNSFDVKIDTVAPETSLSPAGTLGENGWYVSPVIVTLTASDSTSGVTSVDYRIDGGAWEAYTGPFPVDEGEHTLEYNATDAAGNAEAVNSAPLKVNTVKPSIVIVAPAVDSILNSSTVTVSGTASDELSVSRVELSTDASSWVSATGTTSWSGTLTLAEGPNTLYARATDVAGNAETASITVSVDTTPPSLSISSPVAGASLAAGDVEVTWVAADAISGIDHFEVVLDGGSPVVLPATATSHTFAGVVDGAHSVIVTAFDVAGNSVVLSVEFTVDTGTPGVTEPEGSGPLVGISVGIVTAAAGAAALLLWRRRAGGKGKA